MKCNVHNVYKIKAIEKKYGKNADPRIVNVVENMDKMKIGLDEEFEFGCRACGQCCMNRKDILLNPRDIYNIAKELGITPGEVYFKYCDKYIGDSSCLPVVRLKAVGANKQCLLLKDCKCSVHNSKPIVCALYPLGRGISKQKDKPSSIEDIYYIRQPLSCNCKAERHTVRDWLNNFGIPIEDQYYVDWVELISELAQQFNEIKKITPEDKLATIYGMVGLAMYCSYSTEDKFEPQFKHNCQQIREIMRIVMENDKNE